MSATRNLPSRTIPSSLTAVVLLLVAVGLGWLAIARLVQGSWPAGVETAAGGAEPLTWADPLMWAAGIILAVLGLILLLAAVLPGHFSAVRLDDTRSESGAERMSVVVPNSSLARLAVSEAAIIDGVGGVRASAGPRRVDVNVTTPLRETSSLAAEVRDAVRTRFEGLGAQPVPKVVVHTRTKDIS